MKIKEKELEDKLALDKAKTIKKKEILLKEKPGK